MVGNEYLNFYDTKLDDQEFRSNLAKITAGSPLTGELELGLAKGKVY